MSNDILHSRDVKRRKRPTGTYSSQLSYQWTTISEIIAPVLLKKSQQSEVGAYRLVSKQWKKRVERDVRKLTPIDTRVILRNVFPCLLFLNLTRCQLNNDLLQQLQYLTELRALTFPKTDRLKSQNIDLKLFANLRFCSSLTSIVLNNCFFADRNVLCNLNYLTNLKSLSLIGCERVTYDGIASLRGQLLKGLTCLQLGDAKGVYSYINDMLLERVIKYSQQLRRLDLGGCHSITDSAIIGIAMHCAHLQELYLDNCTGIRNVTVHYIAKNLIDLKALSLRGCSHIGMQSMAVISFLQKLEYLDLRGCAQLTGAWISTVVVNHRDTDVVPFKSLEEINVARCTGLTDSDFQKLIQLMPKLTQIDASETRLVRAEKLLSLTNLQSLRLNMCSSLKTLFDHQFDAKNASNIRNVKLTNLELQGSHHLCKSDVSYLLNVTSLQKLEMGYKSNIGNSVKFQSPRWFEITNLTIKHAEIDDEALNNLNYIKKLQYLDLSLNQITGTGFEDCEFSQTLNTLVLQGCKNLTAAGFYVGLNKFQNLESLDLTMSNIDDQLLKNVRIKSLRNLKLSGNNQIRDDGLAFVAQNLSNLRRLNVSFCNQVTIDGIANVSGLKQLGVLDVTACWRIILDENCIVIFNQFQMLRTLQVCSMPSLVQNLKEQLPHIEVVG